MPKVDVSLRSVSFFILKKHMISIIHKYLIKEILKFFSMVLVLIVIIFLAFDFIDKIDDFIDAKLPVSTVMAFFLYNVPFVIVQMIPASILMSVLVVFGLMNRNNEIVALKSSGVSVYYLVKPTLVLGIILSIALFFFSETVVPVTSSRAAQIWQGRKDKIVTTSKKDIWIKGDRLITHVKFYVPEKKTAYGITRISLDEDFNLIKRLDAEKGIFRHGEWFLYDIMMQKFDRVTGESRVAFHDGKEVRLDFFPEDLGKAIKKAEEMSFKELRAYIKKLKREGYDSIRYTVDFYAKMAFPFVCIIMCMAGTGIAVQGNRHKGLPACIAYGIGVIFLYIIFFSLCLSLGYGGVLPPFIAVWIPNLVFLCAGLVLLLNAE